MKHLLKEAAKVLAKAIVYAALSAFGITCAQGCVAGGDVHISLTGQPTVDGVNTNTADNK